MWLELVKLIFVVVAISSGIAMINVTLANDSKKGEHASFFYNPVRILDYISITRMEKGRIGLWFWSYIGSILLLLIFIVIENL